MKFGLLIAIVLILVCTVNVQASRKFFSKNKNKNKTKSKGKPNKNTPTPKNESRSNITNSKNESSNNTIGPNNESINKTIRSSDELVGNTSKPNNKQNDNIKPLSTESTNRNHKKVPKDHLHSVPISSNNNNATNMTSILPSNSHSQPIDTNYSPIGNQMQSNPQAPLQRNLKIDLRPNPQHPLHDLSENFPKDDDTQLTPLEKEILEISKEIHDAREEFNTARNNFKEAELEYNRLTLNIKELDKGLEKIKLLCGLGSSSIFESKSFDKAKEFLHACSERARQKEIIRKSFSDTLEYRNMEVMTLDFLTLKVGCNSNGHMKESKKFDLEQSTNDLPWEYYQKLHKTIESEDKEILEMEKKWNEILSIAHKEMNNK